MSHISPKPEQSTSNEALALTNLAALGAAGTNEFLYKTGQYTFAHAVPTGGGVGTGDMILASIQTVTGAKTFNTGTLVLAGATSGTITVNATAVAGTNTLTMPAATDTLVGKATIDTFTNKTFDANGTGNSISNIDVADLANGTDGELITWDAAGAPDTVAVGTSGHVLTSNGVGTAPSFQAAGAGDVTKVGTPADNQIGVWTGDGTIEGTSDFTFDGADFIFYNAANDGNPEIRLGASDAEEFHIQTVFDSGAQTLDYVQFTTDAASATADKGEYRFNVDAVEIAQINDSGINIVSGLDYFINDSSVINATTLGSTVVSSSLTSVGTIATGVWNGTDIAAADGGTGRSSHTAYAVICGGTTTTAAQQSIASVGTSGQVLTSNGAGALPTFQAAGVVSVNITLSAANITGMNATPVTVIAAPGANKVIVVTQITGSFAYNSVQYTGGGTIRLQYNGLTQGLTQGAFIDDNILKGTVDQVRSSGGADDVIIPINTAVEITNGTAAYAAGDSTPELIINYVIIDIV